MADKDELKSSLYKFSSSYRVQSISTLLSNYSEHLNETTTRFSQRGPAATMMDLWSIMSTLQPHFKAILLGLLVSWSVGLELNSGIISTTLSNHVESRRALFTLSMPTFRGNVDSDSASGSRLLRSTLSNVVVAAETKDAFIFTPTIYSRVPSSTDLAEKKIPQALNPTDIGDNVHTRVPGYQQDDTVSKIDSKPDTIAAKPSQTYR